MTEVERWQEYVRIRDRHIRELEARLKTCLIVINGAEAIAEENECDAVLGYLAHHIEELKHE